MKSGTSECRLGCRFFRDALGFRGGFSVSNTLQMMPDFFRNFDGDRTGVRLLFRYAKSRKKGQ